MKRIWILFILPFVIVFCRDKDELRVLFEMPYQNLLFEIPAGLSHFEAHYFVLRDLQSNADFFLDNNGKTAEQITAVNPHSAQLWAVDGNIDFEFVDEVSVRIYLEDEPNKWKEIFYRDQIPLNIGSKIDLIPTSVNVKDFVLEENFSIEVVFARMRTQSPSFIETRLDFVFDAKE